MDRRIELVISLLENDTSRAWDTHALATLVNLSPSRFRHLFKHEKGTSPRQYLRELRLRKAEILLGTTFLSLKEIAEALGIISVSHLMKDFKERHGMTPGEYRIAARFAGSNRMKRGAARRHKR